MMYHIMLYKSVLYMLSDLRVSFISDRFKWCIITLDQEMHICFQALGNTRVSALTKEYNFLSSDVILIIKIAVSLSSSLTVVC